LKEHTGLVDSLNIGIQSCLHEFIARFDVDDEFNPHRFVLQHEYLKANEDISVVFCDYEFLSSKGRSLGTLPSAVLPELVKLSLINPQRTPHPGAMYRKNKVLEVGGYKSIDFPAEDLGLWIRLLEFGKLGSIPEVLLRYKINSTGISSSRRKEMKSKTTQLLKSFSNSISNEDFFNDAIIGLKTYRQYRRGAARELLTLRDLIKLLLISNMELPLKCKLFFKILLSLLRLRYCAPLFSLFIQFIHRTSVRSGLFH
jgi:glycosyltransferase involved in cell wall biosynthesis